MVVIQNKVGSGFTPIKAENARDMFELARYYNSKGYVSMYGDMEIYEEPFDAEENFVPLTQRNQAYELEA